MPPLFDHEKLEVYNRSLGFVVNVGSILDELPKSSALWSQFGRASISIPLNIAEGNGKWTAKDRCRFFDIAYGSALECAAALDIARARGLLEENRCTESKSELAIVVRMLVGLIKANDPDRDFGKFQRVQEEGGVYQTSDDRE